MFVPSGASKWASTEAPLAARMMRRQRGCRAVGAIDVDAQVGADGTRQAQAVLQVALQVRARVHDAAEAGIGGAVQLVGPHDEGGQLVLHGIVELEAAAVEHLEAVVVGRVMGG